MLKKFSTLSAKPEDRARVRRPSPGGKLEFEGMDSSRVRFGARYTAGGMKAPDCPSPLADMKRYGALPWPSVAGAGKSPFLSPRPKPRQPCRKGICRTQAVSSLVRPAGAGCRRSLGIYPVFCLLSFAAMGIWLYRFNSSQENDCIAENY